jgi:hypothetical protein
MYSKVLIGGVTAAAIVGAGTAALALGDPSGPTPGKPAAHAPMHPGKHAGKHHGRHPGRLLRRVVHGEIVTITPDGFVTHQLIRGAVTDVTARSITVKAMDDTSETFTVTSATKVRSRANGKATDAAIGDVQDGDQVAVVGLGARDHATARRVIDLPR